MAEDQKTGADPSEQKDKDPPGYFESPIEDYPGHIQFPNPLMLHHLGKWWVEGVEPTEKRDTVIWDRWFPQWQAAKMLLLDYGEWAIKGISPGDVKDDQVPAEIAEWVVGCSKRYIIPKLDPRKRLVLSTII